MYQINKLTKTALTVLSIFSLCMTTSCATSEKSILTGAAVGGTIGAGIGSQKSGESAAIGAATGLLIGGLVGYLGYKDKKKKNKTTEASEKKKDDFPFITKPLVRKYSPAPKVEGNKYIRNCEIFEIKENSKWRK